MQFAIAAAAAASFLTLEEISLAQVANAAPSLVALGLFTTAAAFGLQPLPNAIRRLPKAAIIVSAESIFGALGAMAALNERPDVLTFVGATLIFSAILIVSAARDAWHHVPRIEALQCAHRGLQLRPRDEASTPSANEE